MSTLPAAAALAVFALIVQAAPPAPGKDDLWEVTTTPAAAGASMPAPAPAQTNRVCLAKGMKAENYIPRREECRLTDSERTGDKVDYKMICAGRDPMIIAGDITLRPQSYQGRMRMTGIKDGQNMDLTETFSAKLVGDCASSK